MIRIFEILILYVSASVIAVYKMWSTIRSQLFSITKRLNNINDIMKRGFILIKIFSARLLYSLDDYEQRKISRNYRSLKLTILITVNAWASLLTYYLVIFCNDNNVLISLKYLELISNAQRLDLLFIAIMIIFIIMELMWFELFYRIFFYQSPLNDFLIVCFQYNEQKLLQKYRKFLIDFYYVSNFVGIIIYSMSILIFSLMSSIYTYYLLDIYINSKINTIQAIVTSIIFIPVFLHTVYILGQIFLSINFLVFLIEFLTKRFKQLADITNVINLSFINRLEYGIIMFNRFRRDYVQLFKETKHFNGTVSFVLLYIEIGSKAWAIIFCLFHSQQIRMNFIIIISGFTLISLFFFIIGFYSRLAKMPSINQFCYRRLAFWIARRSKYRLKPKYYCTYQQNSIRIDMIKLNLYLQTIANNCFGFTCGQLFFITKFKYMELFLLNIPIIMLFYRKICMME